MKISIDCTNKTAVEIRESIALHLKFPSYYGHNWDAWYECMRDLSWISSSKIIVELRNLSINRKLPDNDYETLNNFFSIISENWNSSVETDMSKKVTFVRVEA